jgi:hypothetical protein
MFDETNLFSAAFDVGFSKQTSLTLHSLALLTASCSGIVARGLRD